MGRTRIDKQHAAVREEIKSTARGLMAQHGTAGVGIRMIAREMDMSAPALYYYFPNLNALITALLEDAFNALADTLEAARDAALQETAGAQLMSFAITYRAWALAHPIDFQLIYGNPIPGYQAPPEVTVPAVIRSFSVLVGLMANAIAHAEHPPVPEYSVVPPELEAHFAALISADGYAAPPLALYLALVAWPRMHGIIILELFHHIQAGVGDVEAYYRIQMRDLFQAMGVHV